MAAGSQDAPAAWGRGPQKLLSPSPPWRPALMGCSHRAPERDWRWAEKTLWVRLAESKWQRAELAGRLRTALKVLSEQAQVLQRQEHKLKLSQARCELLAMKQKQMECSLACLEQKRHQLRGSQEQEKWKNQDQHLEDKILLLQTEVEKVQRRLDQICQQPLGPETSLETPGELLRPERQNWDGVRAQVLQGPDRVSLGAAEPYAQAEDTAFLREQLLMLTQVNKRLSEELGQSHRRLGVCLEQLQQLQGERSVLASQAQALETERSRLLGEKWVLLAVPGVTPAQEACTLQVQEAQVPLRKELGEQESHPRLHEEVAEYWKARWQQVAVALKFKEEELQRLQRQRGVWRSQAPPTAAERPRCVQEDDYRSGTQALQKENDSTAAGIQRCKKQTPAEAPGWLPESTSGGQAPSNLRRGLGTAGLLAGDSAGISQVDTGGASLPWPGTPGLPEEPGSPGRAPAEAEGRAQGQAWMELPQRPPEELEEQSLRPSGEEKTALQDVGSQLAQMRTELEKVWDVLDTGDSEPVREAVQSQSCQPGPAP